MENNNNNENGNYEQENEYSSDPSPRKKRFKTLDIKDVKQKIAVQTEVQAERCTVCHQYLDDVLLYNGHPNNATEEYITLTDERLMLFTGNETSMDHQDERPIHKITSFSVYDKDGHLCPFDTGLIEANVFLYFSGYVKPIYDEDSSITDGLPTKDMGPINEWFITGFDGGKKAIVGFSTAYAEYYLQEPSEDYKFIMESVSKKILLAKVVIEFLLEECFQNPTYEDLLQRLQSTGDPDLTEECLLRHAQFVCDRVSTFDRTATEDEPLLIITPCMRALVKMAGVTFKSRQKMRRIDTAAEVKNNSKGWSKATTTQLVQDVFANFFLDQIEKKDKEDKGPRRQRCGVCEACQTPDCGKCSQCAKMLKFGGTGRSKQACLQRRCPNFAIQEANEDSDNEDRIEDEDTKQENSKIIPCSKRIIHKVKWDGKCVIDHNGRSYYDFAQVGNIVVEAGDYVMLNSELPNEPFLIALVCYMWEDKSGAPMFHAHLFCRGSDTILGETSDPRELFFVDICENCPLGSIVSKASVQYKLIPENWAMNGGIDRLSPQLEDDGKTFFYTKRYDSEFARFEDIVEEVEDNTACTPCGACRRRAQRKQKETAIFKDGCINWKNEVYKIGTGVFLQPKNDQKRNVCIETFIPKENVDIDTFPEFYRKPVDNIKVSNGNDIPSPFNIGLIQEIAENSKGNIFITVRKFYRSEETVKGVFLEYQKDINLLYWSDETYKVNFNDVCGKCYLSFGIELDPCITEWASKGPYRFYFTEGYDPKTEKYIEVPYEGTKIGYITKGKGKGKGKSKRENIVMPPEWQELKKPLKCMDVFAGCGGLSEGLHHAKIANTLWAIEKDPIAARAFKLNNPNTIVFTEDCNDLLRQVISNEEANESKQKLPQKGEVEMLVGGPPCQGFSGMNRFNAGQYSLFKNSLIVSYLSYCDYYRPKYFILENVRNFVSFKRSMVLKLTLRCLLAIGYQVTFAVLQAGSYGVPQTRRRLIIMAAAPGYVLPKYPDPQHVFSKKACQLSFVVDNFRFETGFTWTKSAPYRTITVRDSMSDLPDIKNGCSINEMPYGSEPISQFQRQVRADDYSGIVYDHICKEMAPLVESRMAHVPLYSGADWRDLPNIVIRLSDGNYTNKLRYPYKTKKQKSTDPPHGVCQCTTGKSCDPVDRQFNTLIPWCLPHTADRHNHWAGLYGRLDWDGAFGTTVTNPEPMGKQGKVLHPEQHRVVSVRECARSQGFRDSYQFNGSILDKHRQVGNAVPPPLGCAIGKKILEAYLESKHTNSENVK